MRDARVREAQAREAAAREAAALVAAAREAAAREAAAREAERRDRTALDDGEAVLSLSDDGSASLTLPPVSPAARSPLDGDPSPDAPLAGPDPSDETPGLFDQDVPDAFHEPAAVAVDELDELDDHDESARSDDLAATDGRAPSPALGDELDAELEAEAAAMAPLVELPDPATFGTDGHHAAPAVTSQLTESGEVISVRMRGRGRVPARKVRRVIRRVDPLSVLKLSFAFSLCVFAMFLVAAVLLWSAAIGSGSTDNIESFLVDIGFEDFQLVGADLFRGFVVFGGALVIVGTVFSVMLALLFNLISDIVGGIRFTVIEPVLAAPDEARPLDA